MSDANHFTTLVVTTSNYNAPILPKGCLEVKWQRGNSLNSPIRGAVLWRWFGRDMAEPNNAGSLNGHVPNYRGRNGVNVGERGHQRR